MSPPYSSTPLQPAKAWRKSSRISDALRTGRQDDSTHDLAASNAALVGTTEADGGGARIADSAVEQMDVRCACRDDCVASARLDGDANEPDVRDVLHLQYAIEQPETRASDEQSGAEMKR